MHIEVVDTAEVLLLERHLAQNVVDASFDVLSLKGDTAGIWRTPSNGGEESIVLQQPAVGYWGYWALSGNDLYYLESSGTKSYINTANLSPRVKRRVHLLEHMPPPFAGITISPDQNWLLYTDLAESGSRITLVENFE